MELTSAAAWLEFLGLVHGDLRPANLLLDGNDDLKLADFDCVGNIGSKSQGSAPPWARLVGDEARLLSLYTLTRGLQPYEDKKYGPEVVQLLQNMDFSELVGDQLECITHRCWMGASIQ